MRRINIASSEFEYVDADPDGFRAGMAKLGKLLGARESGISVYELPPGQAVCPYHYEVGEEEWLLVLEGRPTLRHPDGSELLEPWDVVCFPRGPEGAHKVGNEGEETARVLMFSTVVNPTATVYPDSDKIGIYTGDPETEVVVRRDSAVDYFDGET
ncbi:MAG TPA: cupin domain-containing protein [Solirubrobacterales bacterium]|nr:cupin domain-containing protein [Solirubrobacterales bacterium]